MKKFKMFFVAASLLLVTAGVFAGKSKFFGTYAIYSLQGTAYNPITPSVTLSADLNTTQSGNQAQIVPSSGIANQTLWGYNTTAGYVKLYTTF